LQQIWKEPIRKPDFTHVTNKMAAVFKYPLARVIVDWFLFENESDVTGLPERRHAPKKSRKSVTPVGKKITPHRKMKVKK
jgi:hypothetical protein